MFRFSYSSEAVHDTSNLYRFVHPYVIQYDHVFLFSVEKKLRFLRKTFQDISPYSGLQGLNFRFSAASTVLGSN